MRARWRKVPIPLFRPGKPIFFGMSMLDEPTGETLEVFKAFCPECGTLCYQKMEQWFCPKCRAYMEGVEYENG